MEKIILPGLNCGLCGFRNCNEMEDALKDKPELIKRCVMLSKHRADLRKEKEIKNCDENLCNSCSADCTNETIINWKDSLGREYDFILDHFHEDVGPREIIRPHNCMMTRELDIKVGDVLIGRPLGMSCGCPITHSGIIVKVDHVTGVMTWCVTGPLKPRQESFKDIGYYSAEGYEGIVKDSKVELKVGMRHYFLPRRCMLQWRHSGLINYLNHTKDGYQIRVEGLWIG